MPTYKLTYFSGRGLGESIRFMLSYMGKEFEDMRIQVEEWPKMKNTTPFRKLPTLEIDGKVHHQSIAICRYLAHEAGLSGSTDLENFEIDQIEGALSDLLFDIRKLSWAKDEKLKKEIQDNLVNDIIPAYFSRFEERIKAGGYMANGKLSWIDLYIVAYHESIMSSLNLTDMYEKYPHFKTLVDKVQALPGIKEWLQKRPKTSW